MIRFIQNKRLVQSVLMVLGTCGLVLLACRADRLTRIQIRDETLSIPGIAQEYRFFLIADSHISLCDERDAQLISKARERKNAFRGESGKIADEVFRKLIHESNREQADLTIFAGDIIDSAMEASIDFVQGQFERLDSPYLYVLGNHDFEYGKEYFSKKAYREYFPRMASLTGTTEQYVLWENEDLIVAGLNDKNNQFDKNAVNALLPILKGEKPVILVLHVPLQPLQGGSQLEQQANDVWGLSKNGDCRVLIGETACKPNKTTKKLLNAVFAENSPVVAVFAGHIHFYNRTLLKDALPQFVTGAGYYGEALSIHIVPE